MAESNNDILTKFNLSEKEVKDLNIDKNQKSKQTKEFFLKLVDASKLTEGERNIGTLLLSAAGSFYKTKLNEKFIQLLANYVAEKKITQIPRMDLAFTFLAKLKTDDELDQAKFDDFIGVGIVVTNEDITREVKKYLEEKKEEVNTVRHGINQAQYRKEIEQRLRFPKMQDLFNIFKTELEAIIGVETAEEKKARLEKGKKQDSKKDKSKGGNAQEEQKTQEVSNEPRFDLSKVVGRDMQSAVNSKETEQWRKEKFGDIILTRFPPEPNGYLHLGHCRAINFNFSLAKENKGETYLRFDDTNPDKENMEFINSIKNNIEWLGFKPRAVTRSSDNFQYLYESAVKLIKKGKAYVCGLTKQESKVLRESLQPSPFRDTSVEENLRLFENMRMGLYKEGEYSLRAKIDYTHANTTLRDPVIYRIRYTPHPHSGDKWCIYPLYDYTHPICDSIEGITHSCCTLEFEIRRELYYWVLQALDIYRPQVWEYARLNVEYNLMSKRKLQYLVDNKIISGWDDPRVLTIDGMRRRGYTPESLLNFVNSLGVARTSNDTMVPYHTFEDKIRENLDIVAVRSLAVLDPVLVNITNMKDDETKSIQAADFPKVKDSKTHTILGTNKVYIEKSDVLHVAHKDFFGMAPGTLCGLKYFGVFKCNEVIRDEAGNVVSVNIEYVHDGTDKKQKPKTFINWISVSESKDCEIRLYNQLFTVKNPTAEPDFLKVISDNSLETLRGAKVNKNLKLKHMDRYQFERQGYFCVDQDSDIEGGRIIWNRIITLPDKDRSAALEKIRQEVADKK